LILRPHIREFRPPIPCIDLSTFDQVFVFGDSTFCQFVRQRPNKKGKYYFQPNLRILGEKIRVGLNTKTVSVLLKLLDESNLDGVLSKVDTGSKERALIVGSCLWDILDSEDELQGSSYEDHAHACAEFVRRLRKKYPQIVVIWKSPMACHSKWYMIALGRCIQQFLHSFAVFLHAQVHWVDLDRVVENDRATATLFGINRIRYMSASRSWYLYHLQKNIMKSLHVPFLDLYEATYLSSDQLYPSDGRHYRPDLNRKMIGWFFPNKKNTS
jgi:hypothetical protein